MRKTAIVLFSLNFTSVNVIVIEVRIGYFIALFGKFGLFEKKICIL